jgi:hypothetical protein
MDLDRPFDHFAFVDLFLTKGDVKIVFPEIFPVMAEMLQSGLKKAVATNEGPMRQTSTPGAVQQRQPSLHRHSMSSPSPSSEFSLRDSVLYLTFSFYDKAFLPQKPRPTTYRFSQPWSDFLRSFIQNPRISGTLRQLLVTSKDYSSFFSLS